MPYFAIALSFFQIKGGFVGFSIGRIENEYQYGEISGIYVNNSRWFNVSLSRDTSSNALTLNVNGYRNQTFPRQPYVFLGGEWKFGSFGQATETAVTFEGCFSNIKINNEILSLNTTNQYGTLRILQGELNSGCEPPDFCRSNPCPGESSKCVNEWETFKCVAIGGLSGGLGVGAIAAIVFFCILVIVIIVAVIAIKMRRTRNELAAFSKKTKAGIVQDNSRGSSSTDSIPSRKTPSRYSLDSGVDIRNNTLSPENHKKLASTNVIALGSPDEYKIVTSRHDSGSDQRDTGFTDSEPEFGVDPANLTISSIPSKVHSSHVHPPRPRNRQSRSERSHLNYNKKVPFLINRGYLNDTRRLSTSTTPSDEPENIEMQSFSMDIEDAEHYSIGDASLAGYSDSNAMRSSDTDGMRYKPYLERFSESGDSEDGRQLSNIADTFEAFEHAESSGESSDGGFTVSEYDYERRPSYDNVKIIPTVNRQPLRTENSNSTKDQMGLINTIIDECDNESSVDDPRDTTPASLNWDDVRNWGVEYNNLRDTCLAIAQLRDEDEDVETV